MYFLDLEIQRDVHGKANLASPPTLLPSGLFPGKYCDLSRAQNEGSRVCIFCIAML